jgi:hypothetical protein
MHPGTTQEPDPEALAQLAADGRLRPFEGE